MTNLYIQKINSYRGTNKKKLNLFLKEKQRQTIQINYFIYTKFHGNI